MKLCLCIVLVLSFSTCSNSKSNDEKQSLKDLSNNIKRDSSLIDKKKVQLIEAVLNLPDVVRYSKVKLYRKNNKKIYILLKTNEFEGGIPSIIQDGKQLSVLNNLDSLAEELPCYHFRMELKGDTALVNVFFKSTGAVAYGNLNYVKGRWVPDKEFMVGVR